MNINTVRNSMLKLAWSNGYIYPYEKQYPFVMPATGQQYEQYWPWQDETYEGIAQASGMPFGTFLALNHITDKNANDMSKPLIVYKQPDVVPEGYMLTPGARWYVDRMYDPKVWQGWGLQMLPWLQNRQPWQPYTAPANAQLESPWPWAWMKDARDAVGAAESTNGKYRKDTTNGTTAMGLYGIQDGFYADVNERYPFVTAGHNPEDRMNDDDLSKNLFGYYQMRYMPWFMKKYNVKDSPDWAMALHHMGPGGVLRKKQDPDKLWQKQPKPTTWTVGKGQTGSGIAAKNKIPWSDFQKWNSQVKDWTKIRPGDKLYLSDPHVQPGQQ